LKLINYIFSRIGLSNVSIIAGDPEGLAMNRTGRRAASMRPGGVKIITRGGLTGCCRTLGLLCSAVSAALVIAACVPGTGPMLNEKRLAIIRPDTIADHKSFVLQNIEMLNGRYSRDYAPSLFVVDLDGGSKIIQELLDPDAGKRLAEQIGVHGMSESEKVRRFQDYIHRELRYRPEPNRWSTVEEILQIGRADCKGRSLVLLSLLAAEGIESYAGISNGHMWISAHYLQTWHVLETDPNAEGNPIYRVEGFYEDPLYKVFPQQTLKRIPLPGTELSGSSTTP
jgi:hypothetical protein